MEIYGLNKRHYCFANISAMKASIFMKFEIYVYKIAKNHHKKFHKDPCTHAQTQGINMRTHVSLHSCAISPGMHACVHGSLQNFFRWFFTTT